MENINKCQCFRAVLSDGWFGANPGAGKFVTRSRVVPPSLNRSSSRDPIGRPTSSIRLRSVLLIDLSTEGSSTLMCLLRVVAFTAMADTEFETIRRTYPWA